MPAKDTKAELSKEALNRQEENILFQEACRASYFNISLPRTQAMQLQYVVWRCTPPYWPYHVTANKGLRSKGLIRYVDRPGDIEPFHHYAEVTEAGAAVFELLVLAKMAVRQLPIGEVLTRMRHERLIFPKTWERGLADWLQHIGMDLEETKAKFFETYGVKG